MTNDIDLKKKKTIEDYWLKRLSGDLPKISLPVLKEKEAGAGNDVQKATLQIPVAGPAAARLLEISGNSDTALFILFFCSLNLALTKYTGIEDLLIGTISARREGLKDKLILCRNKISGDSTFKETVNRLKQTMLEDFNYATPGEEDYSFGFIYQKLLERSGKDMVDIFNAACIYDKLQN
ncbi:MAG TPA: condensation domain-containing protein, partial [Candidatus Deferrimicrobium sp.]|nr:condensation domain-containing protein [Candidatus Deferrimicrobium sp.]